MFVNKFQKEIIYIDKIIVTDNIILNIKIYYEII